MLENGWTLAEGANPIHHARYLWQVYAKANPLYTGASPCRCCGIAITRPSSIINPPKSSACWTLARRHNPLLRPPELAAEIDALNEAIYPAINNGVYRAGFATTQAAYEEAYDQVFAMLDTLEARLKTRRFLLGDQPTEADWRLFTTLIRFDAVYYGHFKCNRARIAEFPELWDFTRALYQIPGVAETVRTRPDQDLLLRQPPHDQPDRHHPQGA